MSPRFDNLMMNYPLTLTHFFERSRRLFGRKTIATRVPGQAMFRYTYADFAVRTTRLAGALATLGVRRGERVATFAWNSHRHLELYWATPLSGAVLHTLNIRLSPLDLTDIINHAGDSIIFADASLWPVLAAVRDKRFRNRAAVGRREHGRAPGTRAVGRRVLLRQPRVRRPVHWGWLVPHGRRRHDRRGGLRPDHRSDQGPDQVRGEWVSSVDVENLIMSHPKVLEAAVIAIPHPKWVERPLACVVPKPGSALEPGEIIDFQRPQLARWALPDAIEIIEAVPKTSVGKFDKKVLRERYKSWSPREA